MEENVDSQSPVYYILTMTPLLKRTVRFSFLRKMVTLGSLFCLVFVTVFCCCLNAAAAPEASISVSVEAVPSCHTNPVEHQSAAQKSSQKDCCQCDGLTAFDADISLKYLAVPPTAQFLLQPAIHHVADLVSVITSGYSNSLAILINTSATPLYLKHAVLRL